MTTLMAVRSTPVSTSLPQSAADDLRWQQLLRRDPDAAFLYGVHSTGIFCRPTCPSRRPSRGQTAFFESAEAAAQAGFRPCKRCKPTEAFQDRFSAPVAEAVAYLTRHFDRTVTLETLAQLTGLSPFSLQKNFKRIMGVTPKEFAAARRLELFRARLDKGSVTDAIYEAGFSSSSRLYEQASALGMKPTDAQRGAEGMQIRYGVSDCSLGKLLVAATAKGICSIAFGEDEYQLALDLRRRFPHAAVEEGNDDPLIHRGIRFVLAQLRSAPQTMELPLDLRATVFQQRVWKALREIPRGQTRSYAEVAHSLGQPNATRAVARACAANPVAVVNPCHRVIGANGKLTGYRWGVERKKRLLEMEGA